MNTITAIEYAQQHSISVKVAHKRLKMLVEEGKARASTQAIIGHRSAKRGARSCTVPVRGTLYTLNS
ncbi:hypothetical protein QO021_30215 (plasmid) [Pseudomonas amygdali pv. lachrymans]|uniref:hypothetical protein n=1 Tax=Pseudomonas amygdali TaxID=47877 RepID=UPI0006B8C006|nr:hypothetical protein [Pseudomonas amygdali]KPC02043.1 Uncharacterized protein AC501_3329 [Pseudomonas amygdali pv. lachrymans]RMM39238.1 hypothetical protein ALQ79_200431 [Pseudomonas amygdali pv. lachrymans]WIO61363.1 hypothetical protein QO021_30215 [Pseudomonas amygdali pv. lachrymans]